MDKYDKNGDKFLEAFFEDPNGIEDKLPGMVAAVLRESAAEAYEDAAKMVWDHTYMKRVGGADVDLVEAVKAKAADLRGREVGR